MSDADDPTDGTGAVPLVDLARIVGGYRWIEARLFEVVGGWVSSTEEPGVKVLLDAHARQHAWHAELWTQRLPHLRELDVDELTAPATPELGGVLDRVGSLPTTVERVAALHRVLVPRLVVAYEAHLAVTTAVTDAPVTRALELVLHDERRAWRAGEAALQGLLVDGAAVERAATTVQAVEGEVVAAGGVGGAGPTRR